MCEVRHLEHLRAPPRNRLARAHHSLPAPTPRTRCATLRAAASTPYPTDRSLFAGATDTKDKAEDEPSKWVKAGASCARTGANNGGTAHT